VERTKDTNQESCPLRDATVCRPKPADGVVRWILTVRGRLSRFQSYLSVAAADRKWSSRAIPAWRTCFADCEYYKLAKSISAVGHTMDSVRHDHFWTTDDVTFENAWTRLAVGRIVAINRKTMFHTPETAPKPCMQSPCSCGHQIYKWSKTTGPTSPDSTIWRLRPLRLLDGFDGWSWGGLEGWWWWAQVKTAQYK